MLLAAVFLRVVGDDLRRYSTALVTVARRSHRTARTPRGSGPGPCRRRRPGAKGSGPYPHGRDKTAGFFMPGEYHIMSYLLFVTIRLKTFYLI